MGGQALRRSGRTTAERAVRRGGTQLARLDRYRGAHTVLLLGIYLFIPLLFDPGAAGDLDASFELRIRNPHGGDPDACSVVVAERRCRVLFGTNPKTRVIVTTGADDIIRMASGDIGWPQLVSAGRLVLWGDPFLALRFPLLFGLPAGPGAPSLLNALPTAINYARAIARRRRSRSPHGWPRSPTGRTSTRT
jgi:hypothetical protein